MKLLNCLALTTICLGIAACGGTSSNGKFSTNGRAVKGALDGATINLYAITNQGQSHFSVATNEVLETTSTRTDGSFSITGTYDHYALAILTPNAETEWTCDQSSGCVDEWGSLHEFGERFEPPSNFRLYGILKPGDRHLAINAITHLVAAQALSHENGPSPDIIDQVSDDVELVLGLQNQSSFLPVSDITQASELTEDVESLNRSLLNAAFMQWSSSGESNDSLAELPLGDLFYEASQLASLLASASVDIEQANTLTNLSQQSQERAERHSLEGVIIARHPVSTSITEGNTLFLDVVASGDSELTFQWYKDGSVLNGETGSSLSIDSASLSDSGLYSVAVSDDFDTALSTSALITVSEVMEPPSILRQPIGQTLNEGENILLSVGASGDELRYQWQLNSAIIPGATNSSLTISNASLDDQGQYSVLVSNNYGQILSSYVTVSVQPVFEPINITQQPSSLSVEEGDDASFSVAVSGEGFIVYQWIKDGINLTGENSASLRINNTSLSSAGTYQVILSNPSGQLTSSAANLEVRPLVLPVDITQQPVSASLMENETMNLLVTAEGTGPINYQWYFNGSALSGETSPVLTYPSVQVSDAGNYTVTVSNSVSSQTSIAATVAVEALPIIPVTHAIALNWSIPTLRTDGSFLAISDIEGYTVRYGRNSQDLESSASISGGNVTSYVVENLSSGRYYFAIETVEVSGESSPLSNVISIDLP